MKDNDQIISQLTVRIVNTNTKLPQGSGVICRPKNNKKILYVITAAHCLFADGENFTEALEKVNVEIYSLREKIYKSFMVTVEPKLLFKDSDKDVGVLMLERESVENIVGEIPEVFYAREEFGSKNFIIKGFPRVTAGELDILYPIWQQRMTTVYKFQLKPDKVYSATNMGGYSGSGIFINEENEIYLIGIFARYRADEKGNIIYCQYLDTVNEILESNYLPPISFSYIGKFGINPDFFSKKLRIAIKNLGPRFSENLNFRLPIARKFNDLAKDTFFRKRAHRLFDEWLTEKSYRLLNDNEHVGPIETLQAAFKSRVIAWFLQYDFSAENKLNIDWIEKEIGDLDSIIGVKIHELYKLQSEEEKDKKKEDKYSTNVRPFENEISRLREIDRGNSNFLYTLSSKIDLQLVNSPFLLIQGDAGEGKSHILGDIANERLKRGQPAILLLGQLFVSTKTISSNILEQLGLRCTFDEFLITLNSIGKQTNSRVLLMIDALNESKGMEMWKDTLAGFIAEVSLFPHIALVLTVRSTYFHFAIPDNLKSENSPLKIVRHQGFRGKEYEALKLFCSFYGLRQPTFPIIAPEFTNPLFLQMVCIGVANSQEKSFPVGFHGMQEVFDFYIDAVNKKLLLKAEYANRHLLVAEAIKAVALATYHKDSRFLSLEDALRLFDDQFSRFPNLLTDLIQENVIIRNGYYNGSGKVSETISFAFERFGDFIIAQELLGQCKTLDEVRDAFSEHGKFSKLVSEYYNEGIAEALAVLLPEQFDIEFFEVLNWKIVEEKDTAYKEDTYDISLYFFKSLKWRSPKSINIAKIENALDKESLLVNDNDWFSAILEFSAITGHPMNSDYLYDILSQYSMPERDSFWQDYLLGFGYSSGYSEEPPLRRLIDWSWTPGISERVDFETARLTGQCLAWTLASTSIGLRDKTTKAMVNLLQQQPKALVEIVNSFREIDDVYIQERLYAVTYGCMLRCSSVESIADVAKFVYEEIFRAGNPPKNILLRDYARNICEFGLHVKSSLEFDMKLIRPPYQSKMPLLPSKDDISRYEIPYDADSTDIMDRVTFNQIHHSVTNGDFGHKVVDSSFRSFSAVNSNAEMELREFRQSLDPKKRKIIKGIDGCVKLMVIHTYYRSRYNITEKGLSDEDFFKKIMGFIDADLEKLTDEEAEWMKRVGIPTMRTTTSKKEDKNILFTPTPIKYWIVKRAFELGWDIELHGTFDKSARNYNNRHNNKVERIGKKYQWIAYYEILGIIADKHKLERGWNSQRGQFYKGAWQLYLRNLDPAYITPNPVNNEDEDDDDTDLLEEIERAWWDKPEYHHWDIPDAQWAFQTKELPSGEDVLIKTDTDGIKWLHLQHYMEWKEPKSLGADRYGGPYKRMVYLIQGYLIKKNDKKNIMEELNGKSFWGRWMPDNDGGFSRLVNREKFWSPAYKDEGDNTKWIDLPDTSFKIMIATTDAKGSMEDDQSGANRVYNMPCQVLYEGLGLRYADNDGDFMNADNVLVVHNPDNHGIMVRLDVLEAFLEKKKLAIIWTLLGEKIADPGTHSDYQFGVPCGVFSIEKGKIEGTIKMHERD